MMSRKLGETERALVAGTGYAATRPRPSHPSEMEDWDWLRYKHRSEYTTLHGAEGETVKVLGQARLEVDSVDALYHFTLQNLGATVLPEHLAARGEAEGKAGAPVSGLAADPIGAFRRLAGHIAPREPDPAIRALYRRLADRPGATIKGPLRSPLYTGGQDCANTLNFIIYYQWIKISQFLVRVNIRRSPVTGDRQKTAPEFRAEAVRVAFD